MNFLDKKIKDIDFVVFDLETTGLFPVSSKIIEIGAVKFNNLGVIDRLQSLIDPEILISPDSTKIHGIVDNMVEGKPLIQDYLPTFFDFIKDCVLIAHNSAFDASFISYSINKYAFNIPDNTIIDTIPISKKYIQSPSNYKLSNLVDFLDVEIPEESNFHRALFDAECCMGVFNKLLEMHPEKEDISLRKFLGNSKIHSFSNIVQDKYNLVVPESFLPIKNEIGKESKINITYKRVDGEITQRDVTPLSFIKVSNKIYLEAFCYLRNEKRSFRLTKILDFSI
ncbi:MAG: exonuclease domain-containing protein [Cyanobacteriota bacterium]